jgi:hypothetical protein
MRRFSSSSSVSFMSASGIADQPTALSAIRAETQAGRRKPPTAGRRACRSVRSCDASSLRSPAPSWSRRACRRCRRSPPKRSHPWPSRPLGPGDVHAAAPDDHPFSEPTRSRNRSTTSIRRFRPERSRRSRGAMSSRDHPVTNPAAKATSAASAEAMTCAYASELWCPRGDLNPHPLAGTSTSS